MGSRVPRMESRGGGARGGRIATWAACATFAACALGAADAGAASRPADTLTYLPYGFIHNTHGASVVRETYSQLQSYGIGQALLPMPNFKKDGTLKLSRTEQRMLALWTSEGQAWDTETGGRIVAVASLGGKVKGKSLNLEEAAVRTKIVAGVEAVLALGAEGVSLDLEPYPTTPGFVTLLQEIRALLAHRGFTGRLSVTAPATVGRWSPRYMGEVTASLDQVDPLFYDSERKTAAAYEQWVEEGLADYSANTAPGTRIVPDIPSYGTNRWHDIEAENIGTATTALETALGDGDRVNGAGIFWWWGFYYDEEGEGSYEGAPDRASWTSRTVSLPFAP